MLIQLNLPETLTKVIKQNRFLLVPNLHYPTLAALISQSLSPYPQSKCPAVIRNAVLSFQCHISKVMWYPTVYNLGHLIPCQSLLFCQSSPYCHPTPSLRSSLSFHLSMQLICLSTIELSFQPLRSPTLQTIAPFVIRLILHCVILNYVSICSLYKFLSAVLCLCKVSSV